MSLIIFGLVILGGLIYIFYTVFSYVEQSTPLANRIRDLQIGVEQKQGRLAEYQHRVAVLQEELPGSHNATARLEQWIDLLRQQKVRVEGERQKKTKAGARGEALKEMLTQRKQQGGGRP